MEEETKGRLGNLYELAFDSEEQPLEEFREDEQLRYVQAAANESHERNQS